MSQYDVTPPPELLASRVRLRTGFTTTRGEVTAFLVQLEYRLDGDWAVVVRYDHHSEARMGHDVTKEGLHRDVYRDGEKSFVERVTGPTPAKEGLDFAEEDLRENAQRYIKRFEKWHGIRNRTDL